MTYSPPATGMPDPRVLSSGTPEFHNYEISLNQGASSATWSGANTAYFIPVRLSQPRTYVKAWWLNGTVVSGNVDVGIYTKSGATMTRVAASTAEAQATASVMQVAATFPTTTIGPGLYYLAMSCTSATATFWVLNGSANGLRSMGMMVTTTSHPLPPTTTAAVTTVARFPHFGFSEVATI